MVLLKKKTFEIETVSPVLKAEDAQAIVTAEEVIKAAEEEAAKIREEAKVAYEEEKKRGYNDGIAEGREEILMQKIDLVDESVKFMENVEMKMADIVVKALKKCVSDLDASELVAQIVKRAMQACVRNQRQITIKVNPEMRDAVKMRVDGYKSEFPSLTFIEVVEDPHLSSDGCVVETEAGIVEASVSGQLSAIEKSIEKHFQRG